jgi:hypothetical protein
MKELCPRFDKIGHRFVLDDWTMFLDSSVERTESWLRRNRIEVLYRFTGQRSYTCSQDKGPIPVQRTEVLDSRD